MDRIPVDSSNIAEIGYDPDSATLEVLFNNESLYQYFDVPETVYEEFLAADSKGKYFNANIRNSYRYDKL